MIRVRAFFDTPSELVYEIRYYGVESSNSDPVHEVTEMLRNSHPEFVYAEEDPE